MGGMGALMGMMPGMKKAQAAMAQSGMDDKILLRMQAMIGSMTPKERSKPELLAAKRKIRIANGSGTTVQDVNKLIKMHQEMAGAMKKLKKMGGMKGLGALMGRAGGLGGGGLGGLLGGGGGMPQGLPPGFDQIMGKK
jgi:signal recognition particle subunit SRP54